MRQTRATLPEDNAIALLDFDTASELLYRVIEELHAYTLTFLSARPRWQLEPTAFR